MKKLAMALVCLVSLAFFASCTPEGQPVITVLTEDGYVQNNSNVNIGEEVLFGFQMTSAIETNAALATLVIKVDDQDPVTVELTGTTYTYKGSITYNAPTEKEEQLGTSTITATVTDALGAQATATITLNIFSSAAAETLTPTPFEWNRHGSAAATGLEEFGLQWTSNGKEDFAKIKPLDGATLYEFDAAKWDATTTELEKAALFTEQTLGIAEFKKVSAWAGHDYDFVIGTTYNGKNYLIHITKSKVDTFKGTDITIIGEWK